MSQTPSISPDASPQSAPTGDTVQQRIAHRAAVLLREHQLKLWKQTDRLFAMLLVLQWLAGIAVAIWVSPRAWEGLDSHIHPHVWLAIFLGAWVAVAPISLAILAPGAPVTRYVISAAQVMHSALLIHLSGGRIETHFHIFGSLAFLSFYRDWRALIPATVVIALDHGLRGVFYPQSVFGVATASHLRWIEHAGWVIFEDIFLAWACIRGAGELATLAMRQAELEATNDRVQEEVRRQTERLESVSQELVATARRAGMAEIATGVLHNVGNVLNSVNVSATLAVEKVRSSEVASLTRAGELMTRNRDNLAAFLTADDRGKQLPAFLIDLADCLTQEQKDLLGEMQQLCSGIDHVVQIVNAQQQHAKNNTMRERVAPSELFEQALAMNTGSRTGGTVQIVRQFEPIAPTALDKHKVLQILINFLSNAHRAIEAASQTAGRIVLTTAIVQTPKGARLRFEVSDNGAGIAPENLSRIFSHGFTTRQHGHGFGLHSAANAAREMQGDVTATSDGPGCGARFVLELPMDGLTDAEKLLTARQSKTR